MRKLVWLSLLLSMAWAATGQMTLSGQWSTSVQFLPSVSLTKNLLTLSTEVAGFKVGGTAEFYGTSYVWQTFSVKGTFGPVELYSELLFGPLGPAFLYTWGYGKLTLAGLDVLAYTAYVSPAVPPGPSGGAVLVASLREPLPIRLEAGFGAQLAAFTIFTGPYSKTFDVDPFPGGLQFTYLSISASKIPFCCGINVDMGLRFTKTEGFESLTLKLAAIPLCCGVSLDAKVSYTPTLKSVEVTPKWAGIKGCLGVYGDAVYVGNVWQGIALYGLKVRCEIADCKYLEVLHAFNVTMLEQQLEEDIFQATEFEYLKLGFCGPGCCGGKYTLTITAYFQPMGSLFGLRRLKAEAAIPVFTNFTLDLLMEVVVGSTPTLALGWTFAF